MDSAFKVPYTTITKIIPHPGADRLELAFIYGFQIVVPKGRYTPGSKVVYIPVDSILGIRTEALLFPADAKVKLNKSRVRQIKLRGEYSQGLIADPETLKSILNLAYIKPETDVAAMLDITKFEPEPQKEQGVPGKKKGRKKMAHPDFHSYNGIQNIKWMPASFEGKEVVIQEKIHGTNARAAKLPFRANTILKKIKKFFGYVPEFENVYGSNRVDITNSFTYKGFYNTDIYGETFRKLDVFNKLKLGETVFGEIYGPGIQKGYTYGLNEPKFILFDVKVLQDGVELQRWLTPDEVKAFAKERGFDFVPELYKGVYNLELVKSLTNGASTLCPEEKVKEGVVVKLAEEYSVEGNKQCLKSINEEYLADQSNTDNH